VLQIQQKLSVAKARDPKALDLEVEVARLITKRGRAEEKAEREAEIRRQNAELKKRMAKSASYFGRPRSAASVRPAVAATNGGGTGTTKIARQQAALGTAPPPTAARSRFASAPGAKSALSAKKTGGASFNSVTSTKM
jgi:hypothetical protein